MNKNSQQKNKKEFTDKEIENFVGFFDALKAIHIRLISEGWQYENEELIPPNAVSNNQST